jgi:hypothetical protein
MVFGLEKCSKQILAKYLIPQSFLIQKFYYLNKNKISDFYSIRICWILTHPFCPVADRKLISALYSPVGTALVTFKCRVKCCFP